MPGRRRPRRYDLTRLGRWIHTLCIVLDVNQPEVAKRAGINKSTVSKYLHPRQYGVDGKTVRKIVLAFEQLAMEKGIMLPAGWKTGLMNAAGLLSAEQLEQSERVLEPLERRARALEAQQRTRRP